MTRIIAIAGAVGACAIAGAWAQAQPVPESGYRAQLAHVQAQVNDQGNAIRYAARRNRTDDARLRLLEEEVTDMACRMERYEDGSTRWADPDDGQGKDYVPCMWGHPDHARP